ncbi:MAG: efflux RND transporter periplasmic adaptor subunit [Thermogutta sp.]
MNLSNENRTVFTASLVVTALVLGSVGGGYAVWQFWQRQVADAEFLRRSLAWLEASGEAEAEGQRESPPALIRVGMVERKAIQPTRAIVGRLTEIRKVVTAAEVAGKIIKMPIEEGTDVIGGQTILAEIDEVWPRLALRQSEAQRNSIQAQLQFQEREWKRVQNLIAANATTESELDRVQAALDELKARLAETEAVIAEQEERLARAKLVAPFDGVVVAKLAELGGYVTPGTPVAEIVSRGEIDARIMIPESAVELITVGQPVTIHVDPLGEEFEGTVVSVTPYGPGASRTFPARVRLDDRGGRLKVGMSVTAWVPVAAERESLAVHRDAVLIRPDESLVWVAVPEGEGDWAEVFPVPVNVTARTRDEFAVEAETEDGRRLLVAGARVVIEGAERLSGESQRVRIVPLQPGPGPSPGDRDRAAENGERAEGPTSLAASSR